MSRPPAMRCLWWLQEKQSQRETVEIKLRVCFCVCGSECVTLLCVVVSMASGSFCSLPWVGHSRTRSSSVSDMSCSAHTHTSGSSLLDQIQTEHTHTAALSSPQGITQKERARPMGTAAPALIINCMSLHSPFHPWLTNTPALLRTVLRDSSLTNEYLLIYSSSCCSNNSSEWSCLSSSKTDKQADKNAVVGILIHFSDLNLLNLFTKKICSAIRSVTPCSRFNCYPVDGNKRVLWMSRWIIYSTIK